MAHLSHEFLREPNAAKQRFSELYALTAKAVPFSTSNGTKVEADSVIGLKAITVQKWEAIQAVALTSEPLERFCMKLSMVLCTRVRLPVFSAAPICDIRL